MKLLLVQIVLLAITTAVIIIQQVPSNDNEQPMIHKNLREMSASDRTANKATAASLLAFLKNEGVTLSDLDSFKEMVNLG